MMSRQTAVADVLAADDPKLQASAPRHAELTALLGVKLDARIAALRGK